MTGFPEPNHDHHGCIDTALNRAERLCRTAGARLTESRRDILRLVWASHAPIGAYELIDRLSQARGGVVAPPTVYRALDFLIAQGLVHKVVSRNAFIGCSRAETVSRHDARLLICEGCGSTAEIADSALEDALDAASRRHAFAMHGGTLEIAGFCPDCAAGKPGATP